MIVRIIIQIVSCSVVDSMKFDVLYSCFIEATSGGLTNFMFHIFI